MKIIKLLLITALTFTLYSCGTTESIPNNNGKGSILEIVNILDSASSKFIEFANLANGDLKRTLELTNYWLLTQPNVQSAFSLDDGYIDITLKSGLKTTFYFDEIDDNGNSVYRGGGGLNLQDASTELSSHINDILSKNLIENKKVLLFETDTHTLDLEPQIKKTTDILNNSGLGFDVTVMRNSQCTVDKVETFKDYGLVIIDGHGQRESFQLGQKINLSTTPKNESDVANAINSNLGSGASDKFKAGKLQLAKSVKGNPKKSDWVKSIVPDPSESTWLSGKYVATLPEMPKTIIFGNMCYSGWMLTSINVPDRTFKDWNLKLVTYPAYTQSYENAIGKAFTDRKLISYYGFSRNEFTFNNIVLPIGTSRKVPDDFSIEMENMFVGRLAGNQDSTGIANLMLDNKTEYFDPDHGGNLPGILYFRHYLANDYSYFQCPESMTDTRDGHVYKVACIGKQIWMAENLNFDVSGSSCYDEKTANCSVYGKLYSKSMVLNGMSPSNTNPSGVQGICPKGWHLPSDPEWKQLFDFLGGYLVAGSALKAKSNLWTTATGPGTNSSGFDALPGGEWVYINSTTVKTFQTIGLHGMFHTASDNHPGGVDVVYLTNQNGIAGFLINIKPPFPGTYDGNVSCRCLKD